MIKQSAFVLLASSILLVWGCSKDSDSTPANTPPTGVSNSAPTNVTSDGATFNGIVGATGGSAITSLGFAYSKTILTPTTSDQIVVANGTALGGFSASVNGLDKSTQYYVRSYAVNSVGTSYGTAQTFTTTTGGSPSITSLLINKWKLTGYKENDVDKAIAACDQDDIWELKADGTLTLTLAPVKCGTEPDSFDDHWSLAADDKLNLFGLNHINLVVDATTMKFDFTGTDNIKISRTFTKQ